jgi:hypothetical protein
MANTSRISGFKVLGSLNGGFAGKANIYRVASAGDEILVGDIVKQGGSADANGIPTVDICGASDVPLGVVVGVLHSKFDPVGNMTSGSVALDIPAAAQIAASGAGYVLVCDDPDVVLEVEAANGTPAVTDVGLNASHANGARTSTTVVSPAYIDFGTEATTNTLNFQVLGLVQRINNEMGASAKLKVRFNVHQYKTGTGSTGV